VQTDGEMHMVGHTAGAKAFAFLVARNSREVSVQSGSHAFGQQWTAVFRAEHNVDQQEAE